MKTLLILLFTITAFSLFAQKVEYVYDDAGNRVQRKLCLACRIANPNVAVTDTVEQTTAKLNAELLPNPTKGNLAIQITQENIEEEVFHLFVYDVYGRELINKTYYTTSFNDNISNYAPGIYYVRLVSGNKIKNWNIIKE
ncbi:MAG: T9SS type A sorting domain-containing protein [Vicingaceae bacterium]|nr:T9SS type A sorting domain-containing protein [Vicingaceae bacterium]